MRSPTIAIAALLALAFPFQDAHAYTECQKTISQIFSGDDGNIWFIFVEGGSAAMLSTDPDLKNTLALAMTAVALSRTITIRYAADSVACNSTRVDVVGFYLH